MDDYKAKKRLAAVLLTIVVTLYTFTVTADLHWMRPIDGWALFFGGVGIAFGLVSDDIITGVALRASRRVCYFWFILALALMIIASWLLISVGASKGAVSGKQWAVGLSVFLGISAFAVAIAAPFGNYKCWQKGSQKEPTDDGDGEVGEPVGDVGVQP
jgi:opacity protein-like surface antigen